MSRIPIWLLWVLGAILLLTLLAPGIHLAETKYECAACASTRTIRQCRWGAYWPEASVKLSQAQETVTLSRFFVDWLASGHSHSWLFRDRSASYAFGINKGVLMFYLIDPPQWLKEYEKDADFRAWLFHRVKAGDLSQADLVAAAVPEPYSKYKLLKAGDRWHAEYKASLKPER